MRLSTPPSKLRVDEENPYWISFSDLMSALLVVFILTAVALIIELTETQKKIENDIEQLRNSERARKDILYEIKEKLAAKNIIVELDEEVRVLRIPEKTLTFASNSDKIPWGKKRRESIKIIGEVLHAAINAPFNQKESDQLRIEFLDTVFIEGHTDSVPTDHYKGGNWGLSSSRAISLWEFWGETLTVEPSFDNMRNAKGQKLFSISGFSSSRRIQMIEKTRDQRAANRRIDIRFTVKRPTILEFKKIIDR
ncbi:MAG: OmpA family protein [Pseudomonadota bacterium]